MMSTPSAAQLRARALRYLERAASEVDPIKARRLRQSADMLNIAAEKIALESDTIAAGSRIGAPETGRG